jgi:hypothetical protein
VPRASRVPSSAVSAGQSPAAAGGGAIAASRSRRIAAGQPIEHPAGGRRADAGQQLQHAEPGDAVARVLRPAQHRQHVLDVRRLEELQAADT